jgi:hypothetical protein
MVWPRSAESIEYIPIPPTPLKETLAPSGGVKSRGPSTFACRDGRKKTIRGMRKNENFIMGMD